MSYLDHMKVGNTTYEIKDPNAATPTSVSEAVAQEQAAREQALETLKSELEDEIDEKADNSELSAVAKSGSYNDLANKPTIPSTAQEVSALPDTTKYGAALSLSIDGSTYVITATLRDQDGNTLGAAQTIDLPLESVVVGGSYDSTNKKVILTLKDGSTVEFSVADLIAGLQSEITATNKLDADLVDDSVSVHKFVSTAEKTTWNGKQNALTFDSAPTQGSTNPVTSGGIYTVIGNLESLLTTLISGNGAQGGQN